MLLPRRVHVGGAYRQGQPLLPRRRDALDRQLRRAAHVHREGIRDRRVARARGHRAALGRVVQPRRVLGHQLGALRAALGHRRQNALAHGRHGQPRRLALALQRHLAKGHLIHRRRVGHARPPRLFRPRLPCRDAIVRPAPLRVPLVRDGHLHVQHLPLGHREALGQRPPLPRRRLVRDVRVCQHRAVAVRRQRELPVQRLVARHRLRGERHRQARGEDRRLARAHRQPLGDRDRLVVRQRLRGGRRVHRQRLRAQRHRRAQAKHRHHPLHRSLLPEPKVIPTRATRAASHPSATSRPRKMPPPPAPPRSAAPG